LYPTTTRITAITTVLEPQLPTMAFLSRLNKAHPDPENFPPARNVFDILPDSVEMPNFIKDEEVRCSSHTPLELR
jgi:hypothetical protein